MSLIGWKEGEVVATVSHGGIEYCHGVPQPCHGEVGTHDEGTEPDGPQVGQKVLNRVGIDGDDTSGGSPLMMDLVDVLVEFWMMKKPACINSYGM